MRLALTVVYIISPDDERLLDIHLAQIEKHTSAPYTIYAAVNRLLPQFRAKLERRPDVRICDLPTTSLRGKHEHSFYQERLIAAAIEGGATHVCTLHGDSFPIRHGWETEISAKLKGRCVLASIMQDVKNDRKPNTACLMFTRAFYSRYGPTLLLPEEELQSPEFLRYGEACPNVGDSGVGYGYKVFREKLSWFPLERSDRGGERSGFGGIYGDSVFHLAGAVRYSGAPKGPQTEPMKASELNRLRLMAKAVLPGPVRKRLRGLLRRRIFDNIEKPLFEAAKSELYADPEGYIERLRQGARTLAPAAR